MKFRSKTVYSDLSAAPSPGDVAVEKAKSGLREAEERVIGLNTEKRRLEGERAATISAGNSITAIVKALHANASEARVADEEVLWFRDSLRLAEQLAAADAEERYRVRLRADYDILVGRAEALESEEMARINAHSEAYADGEEINAKASVIQRYLGMPSTLLFNPEELSRRAAATFRAEHPSRVGPEGPPWISCGIGFLVKKADPSAWELPKR